MEFEHSDKVKPLQEKLRRFMDDHIYPNERRHDEEIEENTRQGRRWTPLKLVEELKAKARTQGLWNLWWPKAHGGELSNVEYATLCEIMGRVVLGAGGVQLLRSRHRQHGDAHPLRHAGAEGAMAQAAHRGEDPVLLRDDGARGRFVGRDQHPHQHRPRRRSLRRERPQVVVVGCDGPALPDLHPHGQDQPGRAAPSAAVDGPDPARHAGGEGGAAADDLRRRRRAAWPRRNAIRERPCAGRQHPAR